MHPSVADALQFFTYAHLPPHLAATSEWFYNLAMKIAEGPNNSQTTISLNLLCQAKDAAVRAIIYKDQSKLKAEMKKIEQTS